MVSLGVLNAGVSRLMDVPLEHNRCVPSMSGYLEQLSPQRSQGKRAINHLLGIEAQVETGKGWAQPGEKELAAHVVDPQRFLHLRISTANVPTL